MGSALIVPPADLVVYVIGMGVDADYLRHPELRATLTSADWLRPDFTVNILPAGIRGLVIAGIFAATMSSMSAGINSLATSSLKDLFERIAPKVKERELFWARLLSVFWG